LRLFSFGGYGLVLAALALVVFGAYDSYPKIISIPDILFNPEGGISISENASEMWSGRM